MNYYSQMSVESPKNQAVAYLRVVFQLRARVSKLVLEEVTVKTTESTPGISHELRAELQAAAENAVKGVRDLQKMKEACERMDRMREENRKLFGEQDIGVEIIRQMRESR
jgi:hypothetical protein